MASLGSIHGRSCPNSCSCSGNAGSVERCPSETAGLEDRAGGVTRSNREKWCDETLAQLSRSLSVGPSMKATSSNSRIPGLPTDNGVALYGCGLLYRLIPLDRAGKLKAKLLDKTVDVPSILGTIRKNYPYYSGSFRYATLALKTLIPTAPPAVTMI